jgi:hypothetical protein
VERVEKGKKERACESEGVLKSNKDREPGKEKRIEKTGEKDERR